MRLSDHPYARLLDAAPDAMVAVDQGGRITLVNAQAERLFGYGRAELLGQLVEILVPDDVKAPHTGHRSHYAADPQPRPMGAGMELAGRRRDGSTFPAAISLSALDSDGEIVVLAAVRDVTDLLAFQAERERLKTQAERDKLERRLYQSQRLDSLAQLAGGVAHEFNNLLGVISNCAAFVSEEVTKEAPQVAWHTVREDIQRIERAAERAASLTRQLLAFARRDVAQPRPLDLNHVVGGLKPLLARTLGDHVELETDLADGLYPVLADPSQMEQILVNAAVNAADAMPVGGRLTIQTANTSVGDGDSADPAGPPPGQYASLKIRDTGTGMPREVLDRAFEPFFTTKPEGQGTGLGLAAVHGIVSQAGGDVWITSEPGAGTTLTIRLPATSQPADPKPAAQAREGGHGETVLVVEDQAAMREVTRRILARNGYRVITATSGGDAVTIATSHNGGIDLLVTDVVMPTMPGPEAAERIRALHPAAKVLFMSGYTDGILESQGVLKAGVALIQKPFTETSLLAKVSEVIASD
jgi:PAS domain S-box-containing protein